MTSGNADRRVWQLRNFTVIETLIRDHDLPAMVWTVGPLGITGEPYAVTDDAARRTAVESWVDVLGATWWAPHVDAGMTTLRASVKDYQGAAIILRTVLFESDSADQ
jgi:hypothetical protein